MRTWVVCILVVCVAAVLVLILLLDGDRPPEKPVKAVNMGVEHGEVSFATETQKEAVRAGEKLTVRPDGRMIVSSSRRTPTPARMEIPTLPPLPPAPASLTLCVKDTEGNSVSGATATVRQGAEQYVARLEDDGRTSVEQLRAGDVAIVVSHPLILAGGGREDILQEGPNEIHMVVARRGQYSAFLKNKELELVTKGIVTLSPQTDGQKIKEADLSDRSPNDDGLFRFDPVVCGKYLLSVTAAPYLPHEEIVLAREAGELNTIILSERGRITVTVQNEEGNPIGGAHVTLQSAPGSGNTVLIIETNDLTGVASFEDIPAGAYRLAAEHSWYEDGGKGTADLTVRKSRHEVKLTLVNRRYRISGIVYESESKDPVEGAVVVAYLDRDVRRTGSVGENEAPPDASAVSQSDGSYVLENLVGGTYFVVVSEAEGYITIPFFDEESRRGTPEPTRVVLGEEQEASGVDLPVWLPWTVTGRVLLPDGRPATHGHGFPFRLLVGRGPQGSLGIAGGDNPWMDAKDEDGSFEYTCMRYDFTENWMVRLRAASSEYGWSPAVEIYPKPGGVVSGVELRLQDPSEPNVRGFVRDTRGEPIARARVLIASVDAGDSCWTDFDGSYHSKLPPGVYSCRVVKEKFKHQELAEPLIIEENQTYENIDFVLEDGQEIFRGSVSEPDGTPVADLGLSLVSVVEEEGRARERPLASVRTDESGRFELSTVAFIFRISHFRIRTEKTEAYQETVFDTPEWGAENIHLVVERYEGGFGNIGGVLTNHSRLPVARFEIRLITTRPEPPLIDYDYGWRIVTHPKGMFLFERVPVADGPFVVVAKTADSSLVFSEIIPLQKDEVREDITIVLQQSFTVFGRVVGPDGNPITDPVPACSIDFWRGIPDVDSREYYDTAPRTETAPDGSFRLGGLPLLGGKLRIFPRDSSYIGKRIELSIGLPGDERDLGTIVLEEILDESPEAGR